MYAGGHEPLRGSGILFCSVSPADDRDGVTLSVHSREHPCAFTATLRHSDLFPPTSRMTCAHPAAQRMGRVRDPGSPVARRPAQAGVATNMPSQRSLGHPHVGSAQPRAARPPATTLPRTRDSHAAGADRLGSGSGSDPHRLRLLALSPPTIIRRNDAQSRHAPLSLPCLPRRHEVSVAKARVRCGLPPRPLPPWGHKEALLAAHHSRRGVRVEARIVLARRHPPRGNL